MGPIGEDCVPKVPWRGTFATMKSDSFPRGSKQPIFEDSSPKDHGGYGSWDQRPSILGTWTPWDW